MVITLAQVKEYLGITGTTYDTRITALLPIIDAKVKAITGNNWELLALGDVTLDSATIAIRSFTNTYVYPYYTAANNINQPYGLDNIHEFVQVGMELSGTGIASGAYVTGIQALPTNNYATITMSAVATETAAGTTVTFGFNKAYHPVVAKGVQYLMDQETTAMPSAGLTSRRLGPASWSYSNAVSANDGKEGMPGWFVAGLPRYMGAL